MAHHKALITWELNGADFASGKYTRGHKWSFDGGAVVEGSSSPHVVPLPMSVESAVDPEEAFVASLSSCHMLSFLYEAWKAKFEVLRYKDEAVGTMEKIADQRFAVTKVVLHPIIQFGDRKPTQEELDHLHHLSHEACFIANSVKSEVTIEGQAL
jgi:organic hydroperoxide reductase OsmC/OhrA